MHRFERAADLGPGAPIRSVRDTAWYSACQSAPELAEKVARQLEVQRGALHQDLEWWRLAQERLDELHAGRRDLAADLGDLSYEQKRLALTALGVR